MTVLGANQPAHLQRHQCMCPLQFQPGPGTKIGKDYTLFALAEGIVQFNKTKYHNRVCAEA